MEILVYNVSDLSSEYTIRKYNGIEIKSKFPVFEVCDTSGKELGFLVWTDKDTDPPFKKVVAYG